MEYYYSQAFIIGKDILEERDRIYHLFTKDFGKINLIAKGSRDILAKLAGHLEMPALVEITFSLGQRPRLITALERNPYLNIKRNDAALRSSFKIGGLVDDLTLLGQPDEEIYQLLFETLYFLDNNIGKSSQIADFSWFYFDAQLLKILGYEPFLNGCVICGNAETHYFSFKEHGLVCSKHYHSYDIKITNNQKEYLKRLFRSSLEKFTTLSMVNLIMTEKKFLNDFVNKFTLTVKSDIM